MASVRLRGALLTALLVAATGTLADESTSWPDYMPRLEPAHAESALPATLPDSAQVKPPGPGVSASKAAFSGRWRGWACRAWQCGVAVAVESVTDEGAELVYARAYGRAPVPTLELSARFEGDELRAPMPDGRRLDLRLRASGEMELLVRGADGRWNAAGVLTQGALDYTRRIERMPTPWHADGGSVTLETLVYTPLGDGPWPTVILHHGSTGSGNDPTRFGWTWTSVPLVRWLVDGGWQVVVAQRRGRGGSGGTYAEGLEGDGSGYTCETDGSLAGAAHALEDLDVITDWVVAHPDVDAARLVTAGVSRGGALAIAHAGRHPERYVGVINFVGGWMGDACPNATRINRGVLAAGDAYPGPTLWLYGKDDPFYTVSHSRSNHQAFTDNGGRGDFHVLEPPRHGNGHFVFGEPRLWEAIARPFLASLPGR